jgi:ribosomal protein L35
MPKMKTNSSAKKDLSSLAVGKLKENMPSKVIF